MKKAFLHEEHNRQDKALKADYHETMRPRVNGKEQSDCKPSRFMANG